MKTHIANFAGAMSSYDDKQNDLQNQIEAKQAKIDNLKQQIDRLRDNKYRHHCPSWIDFLIKPLAEELSKRFSKSYELFGPFGLRASLSIYLKDDPGKSIVNQDCGCLTIVPGELRQGELFYETGEVKNSYRKHTIGDVNGMNNVVAPLPDSFDEIEKLVRWGDLG